jgi:hypothetical protein
VPLLKWLQRLDPAFQLRFASGTRAVHAAENLCLRFDAVPDNPAVAMRTNRRQRVDRALEAIEGVTLPANDDLKRLVIFVPTNFAFSHTQSVRAGRRSRRYRRIVFYVSNTGSTVDEFQAIGDAHVLVRLDHVAGLIVDASVKDFSRQNWGGFCYARFYAAVPPRWGFGISPFPSSATPGMARRGHARLGMDSDIGRRGT